VTTKIVILCIALVVFVEGCVQYCRNCGR